MALERNIVDALVVGSLRVSDKLSVDACGSLSIDPGWRLQPIVRLYTGANRTDSIRRLWNLCDDLIAAPNNEQTQLALQNLKHGIGILKKTYSNDPVIISNLTVIENKLNTRPMPEREKNKRHD